MLARPLTALLTLLVLLSSRPQTTAAQTIVFTPQWTAQAQFAGYYVAAEWWHFTLKNEPFPDTYFTFPVKRLQ